MEVDPVKSAVLQLCVTVPQYSNFWLCSRNQHMIASQESVNKQA